MINPNWRKKKNIKVKCISKKYGNFKYDKVYKAEACSYNSYTKMWFMHRITDEDGDYYTINEKDLDKIFVIVKE